MTYALTGYIKADYITDDNQSYKSKYLNQSTFSFENNKARVKSAVCVPAAFVTSIIDTLAGTLEGIFLGLPATVIYEMGCANEAALSVFGDSFARISYSNDIVAEPFKRLLQTINPKVFRVKYKQEKNLPWISAKGMGLISVLVRNALNHLIQPYSSLYRHIVSRIVCATLIPIALTISRVADGVIGLTAAPFALLFCGRWDSLNHVAYRGLMAPGIVADVFTCAALFFSPPFPESLESDVDVLVNEF